MAHCNSDCWLCDLPVGTDPYKGCVHGCTYCFARRFSGQIGEEPENADSPASLRAFIEGKRDDTTSWADWNIPIRIGSLTVYAGENRIRSLGDAISCCGNDGLEGFVPLTYNVNHLIFDKENMICTKAMEQPNTARAIAGRFDNNNTSKLSFKDAMDRYYKQHTKSVRETFGLQ